LEKKGFRSQNNYFEDNVSSITLQIFRVF